ncbi:SLNL1-like protein [Mya arenaria]|uniref:SLNL1-like protein n=1 Tax=Mya arenaria TaxID=6604 RepID=A0ABY7F2J2_MYAAR|nr:schlafen-like protein 1 [Mya arenaria]WAR16398.1 SLNL1-like protein [Mya arenaria]
MGRRNNKNRNWVQNHQQPPMAGPARAQPSSQLLFRHGEHIGSEDRSTEFKEGPGFIQNEFRANVAKYVSAFVNSHENGRLFLGVNDGGYVTGYQLNQTQEDRLRLQIDDAIKDIKPTIFPNDYSVDFTPVADQNGYIAEGFRSGWYFVVICIMVHGKSVNTNGQLYSTLQGTFMRRDGGVQTLNAQDIHNFYQRKHLTEMDRLKNDVSNLEQRNKQKDNEFDRKMREMENRHKQTEESLEREKRELLAKTSEQQEVIERLKQQREETVEVRGAEGSKQTLEEIQKLRAIIESQHKKSKVCSIS